MNLDLLSVKTAQLRALLQLYRDQSNRLSTTSRLYFGQLQQSSSLAILFDWSDGTCFSDRFDQYVTAIDWLLEEQLSSLDTVHMIPLGSKVTRTFTASTSQDR